MSKILVISTSLRTKSNSETLAREFSRGAKEAGNEVEMITLHGKRIAFCRGCLSCGKIGHCVMDDDAIAIAEKMHDADIICFASPIYYYEMSGLMKTLLDRCNSLYFSDYHFRDIYFLCAAAENEAHTPERAIAGLGGWIECFENARLAGTVFAGGVENGGDVSGHEAMEEAYRMGRNA